MRKQVDTFTTFMKHRSITLFVDHSSTSDDLTCGDETDPCVSIENAWSITDGLNHNYVIVKVLKETTETKKDLFVQLNPYSPPEYGRFDESDHEFYRSLILGSQFSFVSNGIDGTVVRRFVTPQVSSLKTQHFRMDYCSSSSYGGSLSASYTIVPSSIDLTLRDCQFSSSKSDRNGGAVAVILDGSTNEECRLTVDIEHWHFLNTAARTGEGGDVFINVQGDSKCGGSVVIHAKSDFNDKYFFFDGRFIIESSHAEKGEAITQEVSLSSNSSFSAADFFSCNCSSKHGGSFLFIIHGYLSISIAPTTLTRLTSTEHGGYLAIHHCTATLDGAILHLEQDQNDFEGESLNSVGFGAFVSFLEDSSNSEDCTIVVKNSISHGSPSLNMCQLVNSANRAMAPNSNLISGPLGPDNFVECTEVVLSVNGPTHAGIIVAINSLPNIVGELFESCVDTSTEPSFPSVVDKTRHHTFSINSETREIFTNEESGRDWNLCGFKSNLCSSLHFTARVSSRSAFSINAIGNFTAPEHPVILASPCMRLASDPSLL
ncbi:hypothetical protein BLNAU_22650 [Blattamonas nauphoetae]|uniref:Uncharacterized protein n=1 Tax=Blattamonas nauphoetae TaxID=2049346 RepID=A0ABQ9WUJ8_9EUKA|nr:hypothetical protein BLNAU_22650 [Blattamonas nauphoetae]